jgi:hypothetical protein
MNQNEFKTLKMVLGALLAVRPSREAGKITQNCFEFLHKVILREIHDLEWDYRNIPSDPGARAKIDRLLKFHRMVLEKKEPAERSSLDWREVYDHFITNDPDRIQLLKNGEEDGIYRLVDIIVDGFDGLIASLKENLARIKPEDVQDAPEHVIIRRITGLASHAQTLFGKTGKEVARKTMWEPFTPLHADLLWLFFSFRKWDFGRDLLRAAEYVQPIGTNGMYAGIASLMRVKDNGEIDSDITEARIRREFAKGPLVTSGYVSRPPATKDQAEPREDEGSIGGFSIHPIIADVVDLPEADDEAIYARMLGRKLQSSSDLDPKFFKRNSKLMKFVKEVAGSMLRGAPGALSLITGKLGAGKTGFTYLFTHFLEKILGRPCYAYDVFSDLQNHNTETALDKLKFATTFLRIMRPENVILVVQDAHFYFPNSTSEQAFPHQPVTSTQARLTAILDEQAHIPGLRMLFTTSDPEHLDPAIRDRAKGHSRKINYFPLPVIVDFIKDQLGLFIRTPRLGLKRDGLRDDELVRLALSARELSPRAIVGVLNAVKSLHHVEPYPSVEKLVADIAKRLVDISSPAPVVHMVPPYELTLGLFNIQKEQNETEPRLVRSYDNLAQHVAIMGEFSRGNVFVIDGPFSPGLAHIFVSKMRTGRWVKLRQLVGRPSEESGEPFFLGIDVKPASDFAKSGKPDPRKFKDYLKQLADDRLLPCIRRADDLLGNKDFLEVLRRSSVPVFLFTGEDKPFKPDAQAAEVISCRTEVKPWSLETFKTEKGVLTTEAMLAYQAKYHALVEAILGPAQGGLESRLPLQVTLDQIEQAIWQMSAGEWPPNISPIRHLVTEKLLDRHDAMYVEIPELPHRGSPAIQLLPRPGKEPARLTKQ